MRAQRLEKRSSRAQTMRRPVAAPVGNRRSFLVKGRPLGTSGKASSSSVLCFACLRWWLGLQRGPSRQRIDTAREGHLNLRVRVRLSCRLVDAAYFSLGREGRPSARQEPSPLLQPIQFHLLQTIPPCPLLLYCKSRHHAFASLNPSTVADLCVRCGSASRCRVTKPSIVAADASWLFGLVGPS